jgi:hypothetical protein
MLQYQELQLLVVYGLVPHNGLIHLLFGWDLQQIYWDFKGHKVLKALEVHKVQQVLKELKDNKVLREQVLLVQQVP